MQRKIKDKRMKEIKIRSRRRKRGRSSRRGEGAGEEGERKRRGRRPRRRNGKKRGKTRKEEINTFPASYLMIFGVIFGATCALGGGDRLGDSNWYHL